MIELNNVSYEINSRKILDGINLKLEKGKLYGIIGPNGSGKSTLLDVIIGYKKIHQGVVTLDDKNIEEYNVRKYGKKVALVPQEFETYFSYTAREIIEMGRYPYKDETCEEIVGTEMVEKFIKLFNLEELASKNIDEMSGGERQRILFVKALVQDTDYILLDEATSNLDLYNAHTLMQEIKREIKEQDKGVVAVLHDMNLASLYCDEIIMIKEGKILTVDTSDKVLTSEKIKELFAVETEFFSIKGKKAIFSYLSESGSKN